MSLQMEGMNSHKIDQQIFSSVEESICTDQLISNGYASKKSNLTAISLDEPI
jgi:hypothetical protein